MGLGIGLGLSGSGSGGGVPVVPEVTDPAVNSISANGWEADYTTPPTFDPRSDAKYVVVERDGFNASGSAITVTDNLLIMSRLRQAYPNQATPSTSDVVMQDYVYSGDTVTGVTNNSTLAYHKPIAMWLDHDLKTLTGQSYTAKLAVAHWAARSGRPVAAVTFTATDGTTTLTQTISAMTKTTYAASGLSVPHFEAAFDLTTLNNDALITIDAEIFPWVGDSSFTASTDFNAYPSPNFCEMKVVKVSSPIFAYVDTAGNDGTGVASTTEATALANPYLTMLAAGAAIVTADGTDASRGHIKVNDGTYGTENLSSLVVGIAPLLIEGETKAGVIFQGPTSGLPNDLPDKVKFSKMTMRQMANNQYWLSSYATIASGNMAVLDQIDWDLNGFTANTYILSEAGTSWLIENTGDDMGQGLVAGSWSQSTNAIGCNGGFMGSALYNAVGNYSLSTLIREIPATSGRQVGVGRLFSHNFFGQEDDEYILWAYQDIGAEGVAVLGNVFERLIGTTPVIALNDTGTANPSQNVLFIGNTVLGQRVNTMYNEAGSSAVAKSGLFRHNSFYDFNCKSDVFGTDGALIGNWPVINKVGAMSNAYTTGSASVDADFGVGSWLGEFAAIGEITGTDTTPLVVDWTDDASQQGTGLGGGDYSPGGSSALPLVASGLAAYSHDLNGVVLADDGTDFIGACQ